jgi:NADH dehydrogenase
MCEMIRTVCVTGATGFVGRYVVRELLAKGFAVRALVRDEGKARRVLPRDPNLSLVMGDCLDGAALENLARGCFGAIHLVGIIREAPGGQTFDRMHVRATGALVQACEKGGVTRFVHMSALGASPTGCAAYLVSKSAGERIVHDSSLAWTIIRPGLILGTGSEFLEMAIGFAKGDTPPYLFMPYFVRQIENTTVPLGPMTDVTPRTQPVSVEDTAKVFVLALERENAIGETYNLVGPDVVTWPELLEWARDTYAHGSTRKPWPIPAEAAELAVAGASLLGLRYSFPIGAGMARMTSEDSTADMHKVKEHLGFVATRVIEGAAAH